MTSQLFWVLFHTNSNSAEKKNENSSKLYGNKVQIKGSWGLQSVLHTHSDRDH